MLPSRQYPAGFRRLDCANDGDVIIKPLQMLCPGTGDANVIVHKDRDIFVVGTLRLFSHVIQQLSSGDANYGICPKLTLVLKNNSDCPVRPEARHRCPDALDVSPKSPSN